MTETERLILDLAAEHGGVVIVDRPEDRGGGRLYQLHDRSFVLPAAAVERLIEVGALCVDAPKKTEAKA
jgi:hypothetical protein